VRVCVCFCERARETERERERVCVIVRLCAYSGVPHSILASISSSSMTLPQHGVCERERERESVCVCGMCACARVRVSTMTSTSSGVHICRVFNARARTRANARAHTHTTMCARSHPYAGTLVRLLARMFWRAHTYKETSMHKKPSPTETKICKKRIFSHT